MVPLLTLQPTNPLEVIYLPPSQLTPDKRNARQHSKRQIEQIIASIRSAERFTNPILADEDHKIIAGHGRLSAAKAMGLEQVPVIVLAGMTEAQKRALRIADNKIALNSGWDLELLKIELEEIVAEGLDVELTGFSVGEVDVILADAIDPDDDVIPPTPAEPVSRLGDIWRLGPHLVACGDIRDRELRDRLMGGALADAAFLDAPYNVRIDGHAGGKGKIKHREFAMASGEMSRGGFTNFLTEVHQACADISKPGAVHFSCMDHRHLEEVLVACNQVYDERLNLVVWEKSNAGMGGLYRSQHELVFVYRVKGAAHRNNVELGKHGRNRTNVWQYASVNSFKGSRRHDLALHPTVKPTAMVADAIKDVTKPGEIVIDGFLGSGTTLIACERTGRICRGVEIDPVYVDTIIDRFTTFTGVEAVLVDTGETFSEVHARRASEVVEA
jgi:DNA modification methylase